MTNHDLSELELLASQGDWEAAQQLFARLSLRHDGISQTVVDELALAVFAADADRTRAAIEKLRSAED
jgi:hypothetical protein